MWVGWGVLDRGEREGKGEVGVWRGVFLGGVVGHRCCTRWEQAER